MLKITEINEKIETLTTEFDNCFDENWEIKNQDRFTEIESELSELKKLQLDIVNKQSLIKINHKEYSLTKDKINSLIIPFIPMAEKYLEYVWDIEDIKAIPQEEYTEETLKKAKRIRLDIAKIRTTTWKIKDREKDIVKQIWWVTQTCHNTIVKIVEEQEEYLEKIEKHFENKEKERILKLAIERQELLRPYEVENLWMLKLWEMEEVIFNNFLQWCKLTFEQKKEDEAKKIEDDKIAEAKKIEEIKKQAVAEYKEKEVIKEVVTETKLENTDEIEKKRLDFAKYRDSIEYDKYEKEDGKIIFYKKVWEFIISN